MGGWDRGDAEASSLKKTSGSLHRWPGAAGALGQSGTRHVRDKAKTKAGGVC